jgi:hypothetical protein
MKTTIELTKLCLDLFMENRELHKERLYLTEEIRFMSDKFKKTVRGSKI